MQHVLYLLVAGFYFISKPKLKKEAVYVRCSKVKAPFSPQTKNNCNVIDMLYKFSVDIVYFLITIIFK